MTFKERISIALKDVDRGDQVEFAWRCAVRAFPFLCHKGNLNFWEEKDIQKYLYSIIYALDCAADAFATNAANAAIVATETANASSDVVALSVATASAVAADAADSAYIADDIKTVTYAVATAAESLFDAATISDATTIPVSVYDQIFVNFDEFILEDIAHIILNRPAQVSTKNYGGIWEKFQSTLKSIGCEYWGKLYEEIFDDNFELDYEGLKRRINVPKEIRDKGASEVGKYLEAIERQGAERLNEARIIILGDKGVGKTCIARKLVDLNANMTTPEESTAGVATSLWKEDLINIRIWDFAGHTVTHAVHQFFLSSRCLYILVYDGRTEERNRLSYWLDHMKNYGGDSKAVILVNERDQHKIKIPINKLKAKYPIANFFSFNIRKDKQALKLFREYIAEYIAENPSWKNQQIPTSYYAVKEELEQLFNKREANKNQELITIKEFNTIVKKHDITDPENLLQSLNDLGVSLWYKTIKEFDSLILNPEWISHGVYQIINWASNSKEYSLRLSTFLKIFKDDLTRYPESKHQFLFDLMKHYELAYETNRGNELIIPHLLNEDQPAELPIFEKEESLFIKYEANRTLPPNTISRFIVRHHQQIMVTGIMPLVWRYGVILTDGDGSLALVLEDDRKINVSVNGKNSSHFLSEIRNTLNTIFDSYKSEKPELTYNVTDDIWMKEKDIVLLSNSNKSHHDPSNNRYIPMRPVVINYNIVNNYHAKEGANTFDFYECSIELQASLNDLAIKLFKKGRTEDADELVDAAEVLNALPKTTNQEELRKKGAMRKLKRIVEDLTYEESIFHQTVKELKSGISIAQDITSEYNKLADWLSQSQMLMPYADSFTLNDTVIKELNELMADSKTVDVLKIIIEKLSSSSSSKLKDAKSYLAEFKKNEKDFINGIVTADLYRATHTRINRGVIELISELR